MPGLSGRMSTIVKAKISKLLDRAEDPSETLEYSYQKQIELLQNVKKGIADVVTSKKRLQLQEEQLKGQVVKLDTQARQALAAGQEDLARTALERKNVAQTELQSLDSQIGDLEQQLLGRHLMTLQHLEDLLGQARVREIACGQIDRHFGGKTVAPPALELTDGAAQDPAREHAHAAGLLGKRHELRG